ncbi:hypothetical protein WR25_06741 isoform A [Diploscapter pachys]|uniref:Uncharacterized protein n=1 Tax=Diploscapter pachys TaxID=2018661 RepID=A0A2A2LXG3_9BILA|nr:hypothetical protein WR25_06741 isoform A [Diploscapter pachys]
MCLIRRQQLNCSISRRKSKSNFFNYKESQIFSQGALKYSLDRGQWSGILQLLENNLDFKKFTQVAELTPSPPCIEIPKIDIENLRDEVENKKLRKDRRKTQRKHPIIATPRIEEDAAGFSSSSPPETSSASSSSSKVSEPRPRIEEPRQRIVQMNDAESSTDKDLEAYADWLKVERQLVLAQRKHRERTEEDNTSNSTSPRTTKSVATEARLSPRKPKNFDLFKLPIIPSMPIIEKKSKGLQVTEKKPEMADIGIGTTDSVQMNQEAIGQITGIKGYVKQVISSSSLDETSSSLSPNIRPSHARRADQRQRVGRTQQKASKKLNKQQTEEEDSSRTPRIREVSESKSQRHRRRRRSSSVDQEVEVLSAKLETKSSIGVQTKPETPRQSKEMVDEAVGTPRSVTSVKLSARSPRLINVVWQPSTSEMPLRYHENEISSSGASVEAEHESISGILPDRGMIDKDADGQIDLIRDDKNRLSSNSSSQKEASVVRQSLSAALFEQDDDSSSFSNSESESAKVSRT